MEQISSKSMAYLSWFGIWTMVLYFHFTLPWTPTEPYLKPHCLRKLKQGQFWFVCTSLQQSLKHSAAQMGSIDQTASINNCCLRIIINLPFLRISRSQPCPLSVLRRLGSDGKCREKQHWDAEGRCANSEVTSDTSWILSFFSTSVQYSSIMFNQNNVDKTIRINYKFKAIISTLSTILP